MTKVSISSYLCSGAIIHDGGNLVFPVFILEDPL